MYPPIVPYLLVSDGAAAIDFLVRALGAEEKMRVPGEEGRAVMHAEIVVGKGLVMLAEPPDARGYDLADASRSLPVGIMVQIETPAEVDRLYGQALAAGGRSDIEPRNEPWGARFAGIIDPSGHRWWLHAPLAQG
jgi:PhnB protein